MSFMTAAQPQALQSSYASRLRMDKTTLFTSSPSEPRRRIPSSIVSYAEVEEDFDDEDFEDDASLDRASAQPEPREPPKSEVPRAVTMTRHPPPLLADIPALRGRPNAGANAEVLVPIRLTLDYENYHITDFFMWDANEKNLTPEQFAIITCQDMNLPVGYTSNIANAIKNQVSEMRGIAEVEFPKDGPCVLEILLSFNLDTKLYEDRFEFDVNGSLSPEGFARQVVSDMGIYGEFYPAIAHALHEQVLKIKREWLHGGQAQPPTSTATPGIRPEQPSGEEWMPFMETLSRKEMERREMERERVVRRLKRGGGRGGDLELEMTFMRSKRRRSEIPRSPW